ncbi:MAG: oligosaccharide flippase family protein [Clostridia bacterium]|nr:oligosaccharide flippase family protein [Clostridia bacterium]
MKSLFKTVALISFFTFLTRVLGFVFRIILSRVVGAEGLGLYQVASSVFMVLLTIISSGIPFVISRLNAAFYAEKNSKKAGAFLSVALIFTVVLSIIICLIVLISKNLFSMLFTDKNCIIILLSLLPSLIFSAVYCVFRGDLWARGNYFALCVTELYEQVIRIVISLLAINISFSALKNALNLGWSMSIACFFSMALVIVLYFYYGGKLYKPQKAHLKPFVCQSAPITGMRVAGSFVQPLVAMIIPARLMAIGYTNSQALSLYGVAMGMTMPLLFIPTTIIGSLSTALVPEISTAVAQNNSQHVERRATFSISFALAISSLFVPMFMGMGESLGVFLYDNVLSGSLLQSASWVLIPLGLTNVSSSLLNSMGLENKSFFSFLVGSGVMFIAMWFLPALLGINALVVGMGLNYIVVFLMNLRLLKKYAHVNIKLGKLLLKYVAVIIPSGALTAFMASLCEYVLPTFVVLIVGGIISVGSFISLAMVLNLFDVKGVYVAFKNKIKIKNHQKSKNI